MINSRKKGAVGEREFAGFLRERGFQNARRDAQQGDGGSHESPDVRGLPGHHVEVKRVETGGAKAYEWLAQATRDAGASNLRPIVAHRRNRSEWIAILRMEDYLELVRGKEENETGTPETAAAAHEPLGPTPAAWREEVVAIAARISQIREQQDQAAECERARQARANRDNQF